MAPYRPTAVTQDEVEQTARAAVAALSKAGFDSCLVGSMACSRYGLVGRTPNDIDIVVLTSIWTQEELKQRMIAANPSFYTVKSVNPMATYRLLFYRLPGYRRSCKVDLLVPGIMNIPSVPTKHITYVYPEMRMPLMPFLPLLLLKLQAWQDHGESHRQCMKDKQPVDVQDIMELLNLAMTSRKVGRLDLGKERDWLPETFVDAGKSRVKRYVKLYPTTAKQWRYIGF